MADHARRLFDRPPADPAIAPLMPLLEAWVAAALTAVEPAAAVRRALGRDGRTIRSGERFWRLPPGGRVLVAAMGKASPPMAAAALQILGELVVGGCVVTKEGHAAGTWDLGPLELREAGHPAPDERGLAAAAAIGAWAAQATGDDLLLALISGGASALLPSPAPGLTLDDLRATSDLLLRCGAPIKAINAVRKHCETLKGGGLARLALPAPVLGLLISDVVADPLDVIASGPTVPDPTTYADALAVLRDYAIAEAAPAAVLAHLAAGARGERPETPKAADPLWAGVCTRLVARNADALAAIERAARADGFAVRRLPAAIEGEAAEVGRQIGRLLRERASAAPREATVVLGGGETTVRMRDAAPAARGGRNQELALGAAEAIAGMQGVALLALATDGGDGSSPAAGALAWGGTIAEAERLGLDSTAALANHDTYPFWRELGAALHPGPTLTNVNDIVVGIVAGSGD